MPARNVDQILIGNWTETGPTPPVPQWSVDITVRWHDMEGGEHNYSGTHYFPNELMGIPVSAVRHFMEEIIMAAVRVQLGIDSWEDYQ